MTVLIQLVVRQLQLVERHDLLHPCGARRRRVGMQVDSRRRYRIRFAGNHPAGAVYLEREQPVSCLCIRVFPDPILFT